MIPSITAEQLIAGLVEYNLCTEAQLITLLGAERNDIELNRLEVALVSGHVLSPDRLLQLKGTIAAAPILDDPNVKVLTTLHPDVARATGSLLLDLPNPTVAMVEPNEYNVEMVSTQLGTTTFDIWLITAHHFDRLYRVFYQQETTSDTPEVRDIYELLTESVQRRASDIHLAVGEPPVIRLDGRLIRLHYLPLTQEWLNNEVPKLVGADRYATINENFDVDAAYTFGSARFRVNVGADRHGTTVALRKIPTKVPSLDDLGLPRAARDFCTLERGLVLVTGPTGSGKSTTLAAILAHIAATRERHIITLEDPIEFHIPAGKSVVNQRELYDSFLSFPDGLRQALRQDPDVVLVGELRDLETMKTALTAAETGHLVFGTLHTYDAPATVSRLVASFPAEEQDHTRAQLAYILKGIVAQTLLPLQSARGRAAAFEILVSTPAIQNNLRKLDGHNQLRQSMETGRKDGMQTMEMSLVDLVRRGLVREEDAEFAAPDRESFMRRLQTAD